VTTDITEDFRYQEMEDTCSGTEEFEVKPKLTFSETVTAAEFAFLIAIAATFSESCTLTEEEQHGLIFSDSVFCTDVLEEDNYAPLSDVKPDAYTLAFTTSALTETVVPIVDFDDPADWEHRGESTLWQCLDRDVDGTGTQTHVFVNNSSEGPYDYYVIGFTSVSDDFGRIGSIKIRYRLKCDPSGKDFVGIYTGYSIDQGSNWTDATTEIESAMDNEILEVDFTGLSWSVLDINGIRIRTSIIGLVYDPPNLYAPDIEIYAQDIQATRVRKEKDIDDITYTPADAAANQFSEGKDISDVTYTDKDVPTSTWAEKD